MNLSDVTNRLRNDSKQEFECWVADNYSSLAELFYSLSADYLKRSNFDNDFYFSEFASSKVLKEYGYTEERSKSLDAFLFLVASSVEKLTEKYGLSGPLDHIQSYLPESSIKYRLKALSKSNEIDNVRNDYIQLFPRVLKLLKKAEACEEQPHSQQITNFLIFYYKKAKENLNRKGHEDVLDQLAEQFREESNIKEYPFLADDLIRNAIFGEAPLELKFDNVEISLLFPSQIIQEIFKKQINEEVSILSNTSIPNSFLGYEKSVILNDVLKRGRANFDEPYADISPDQKVLLYCYFNMKKHFFSSYAVFKKVWYSFHLLLSESTSSLIFIDLGCGPLTSGLALGDLHKNETQEPLVIHYIGVDNSRSMIEKAKEFTQCELFRSDSTFNFYSSFEKVNPSKLREKASPSTPIVVNASYLFANITLEQGNTLIDLTKQLSNCFNNVHFIFQNISKASENETWIHFKSHVNHKLLNSENTEEKFVYQNTRNAKWEPHEEYVYYEVLKIKN